MKFFNKIKQRFFNFDEKGEVGLNDEKLLSWLGLSGSIRKDKLGDATYFACMKKLSESLGKLSLKMYQNTDNGVIKANKSSLYRILKTRPNPYMTASIFWSTVEMNRNHFGNAYVWCRNDNRGNLKDLWILPSQDVVVLIDDKGILGQENSIYYQYTDETTGEIYIYSNLEILHFKTSCTFNGIIGKPVKEILATTIDTSLESQNLMNNLYKNGLTAKAVLEYTGELNPEAEKRLVAGFEKYASGSKNVGKIIPVPLGMKLVPLDLKLTDSQFFELKKYNALQIAAAFGIMPSQINDFDKASYASAEAQNLSFYVDTLLFILKQYEEEISFKILGDIQMDKGYFFKFNVNSILRADLKTQMMALASAVNNGIYSPNDAREFLDMPRIDGGDVNIVNGNYIPITEVGNQYKKEGE